jgi:hypothetical protein
MRVGSTGLSGPTADHIDSSTVRARKLTLTTPASLRAESRMTFAELATTAGRSSGISPATGSA